MPAWQAPAQMAGDTVVMGGAAAQPGTSEGDQAGGAELRVSGGPDQGHVYRVGDNPLRIGRSPDNDLVLRDPATSGHHARVEKRGATWHVVDLGSTNGTLVNGEPISEKELKHGDELKIGQNTVAFGIR